MGLLPPDPHSLCPLSSTEFVEHPPTNRKKILGTPLFVTSRFESVLFPRIVEDKFHTQIKHQAKLLLV
jgi:hypothetical protein